MTPHITNTQRFIMRNPIIQLFRFFWLNVKILLIVAGGHGGTRDDAYKKK